MELRLCKDCRFYDADWTGMSIYAMCLNRKVNEADPEYRISGTSVVFCKHARDNHYSQGHICGPDGLMWQPKPPSRWKRFKQLLGL